LVIGHLVSLSTPYWAADEEAVSMGELMITVRVLVEVRPEGSVATY
jgi:hypothetical protein